MTVRLDPVPVDEAARLATLHALRILDTPPEERFDRITRLAATFFDVPICLVTFVDEARVWFKSIQGLPVSEIPREQSLCLYSITSADSFVIEDTRLDPCFSDNPLVCGEPHLTFYAGRALEVDGHKLGNFCIIDTKPRTLTEQQRHYLEDLGAMVESELQATHLAYALAGQVDQLREANERLEQADRMKDEFLSVMSHELRTPLSFIISSASVLRDEVYRPQLEEEQAMTDNVLTGADRMLTLVNNLLDVSRIAAGTLSLKVEPVDYRAVVEEVVRTLEPLAAPKKLTLTPDLTGAMLEADTARVIQVLTNLIDNAIKFTPDGGTIRVSTSVVGENVLTEIEDTGPGIAATDIPKLFQRFHQLDMSLSRPAGGAGLGLSIAKGLVEAHGGEIGVVSQPGEGSRFWFTLPRGAG
jgi:signal transduction histidine kinase